MANVIYRTRSLCHPFGGPSSTRRKPSSTFCVNSGSGDCKYSKLCQGAFIQGVLRECQRRVETFRDVTATEREARSIDWLHGADGNSSDWSVLSLSATNYLR